MSDHRCRDFPQVTWNQCLEQQLRHLVRLAIDEDLGGSKDWTTECLVPPSARGAARIVARAAGVVAGLTAGAAILEEMHCQVQWQALVSDGTRVPQATPIARLQGRARDILVAERTLLNFVGHLSGVATLTAGFVDAVAGTGASIYDTRKTLPGWRFLQKYAVRCGGGRNHRCGLHEAILIKDNHLAFGRSAGQQAGFGLREAIERARECVSGQRVAGEPLVLEVEVDSLEQLEAALPAYPDIILLDNMPAPRLKDAVALRDARAPQVSLEASGGVNLKTVRTLAETGVDRISIGALTHSAANWDVGLDWEDREN